MRRIPTQGFFEQAPPLCVFQSGFWYLFDGKSATVVHEKEIAERIRATQGICWKTARRVGRVLRELRAEISRPALAEAAKLDPDALKSVESGFGLRIVYYLIQMTCEVPGYEELELHEMFQRDHRDSAEEWKSEQAERFRRFRGDRDPKEIEILLEMPLAMVLGLEEGKGMDGLIVVQNALSALERHFEVRTPEVDYDIYGLPKYMAFRAINAWYDKDH